MTTRTRQAAHMAAAHQHHPHRWRLNRAGLVNVWYYLDHTFEVGGGRLILRGTNGSGKSRALELLLPFLLDADRRRIDSTGAGRVRLEELMRRGAGTSGNRLGYLWLELARDVNTDERTREHLTLGALIRFSHSAGAVKVWYFTTNQRVGEQIALIDPLTRAPLSRDQLAECIGREQLTESPEVHRERVAALVYGLAGEAGKERFHGLLQLLHTLRSPDVGNRIEEGKLPQILIDALPPLGESALGEAAGKLDALAATREGQQRLETSLQHVIAFQHTYRRYLAGRIERAATASRDEAGEAQRAQVEAQRAERTEQAAERELAAAERAETDLATRTEQAQSTVTGIKESRLYRQANELADRARLVDQLRSSARNELRYAQAARTDEEREYAATQRAGEALTEAADAATQSVADVKGALAAAGMPALASQAPDLTIATRPGGSAGVRLDMDDATQTVQRPPILTVTAETTETAIADLVTAQAATGARHTHALARLETARRLQDDRLAAEAAARSADEAEERAEAEEHAAAVAGEEAARHGEELAATWHTFASSEAVHAALPRWDGHQDPSIRALLSGVDLDDAFLSRLDDVLVEPERAQRDEIVRQLHRLEEDHESCRRDEATLHTERDQLRASVDPAPDLAPWRTSDPDAAVTFWKGVDFNDHLDASARDGLEAALEASGILTAAIAANGTVVVAGQLVTAGGAVNDGPTLLEALHAEDAAEPTRAALAGIGLGPSAAGTWVDTSGRFRIGTLVGHAHPRPAKLIGAQARAAARANRLLEIESALTVLRDEQDKLQVQMEALGAQRRCLEATVAGAPTSHAVRVAAATAQAAAATAARSRTEAAARRGVADANRRALAAAHGAHAALCREQNLPETVDDLRAVGEAAQVAGRACSAAIERMRTRDRALGTLSEAISRAADAAATRACREQDADRAWHIWHEADETLAAIRQSLGADTEAILADLRAAEAEHQRLQKALSQARPRKDAAVSVHAKAAADAAQARTSAVQRSRQARVIAAQLERVLSLDGVAEGGLAVPVAPFDPARNLVGEGEHDTADDAAGDPASGAGDASGGPGRISARALEVLAALRPDRIANPTALYNARTLFETAMQGVMDVRGTDVDDVLIIELVDGTNTLAVEASARDLAEQVEQGRQALTERESQVFTDFVLGGVAEELRRRIVQAEDLVEAMQASLRTIRTSNGISVSLRWKPDQDAAETTRRILQLVQTATDVRGRDANRELVSLLKAAVDAQASLDPAAGYLEHLRAALDYRRWHRMEVFIDGPLPGERRVLKRRAKLSEGEVRVVSYLALIAAVDAYLSGLPDAERALRVLLLDDAFAKVDDPTIGELMGLLVRLDIDFAFTGHSLYGTYPQVPSLDCYEVRRGTDSPAVTTHIHWDGHTRHLRSAQ